jgi:hypothetical protein
MRLRSYAPIEICDIMQPSSYVTLILCILIAIMHTLCDVMRSHHMHHYVTSLIMHAYARLCGVMLPSCMHFYARIHKNAYTEIMHFYAVCMQHPIFFVA